MRLTERDIEIIKTVHDCRVLRGDQLQDLFFGSQSTASYRLARLYQHEYLDRHFLPTVGGLASSPTLYTVGRQGINVLRRVLDCGPEGIRKRLGAKQLSPLFLEHVLQINQVRVAVMLAAKRNQYQLHAWLDDAELKSNYDRVTIPTGTGRKRTVSLIPDSYFTLQVPQGRANFFLELDRGTMTAGRFKSKILAYQAYIASGQYERRYGTRSLRVLTVTLGPKRLKNLMSVTETVGGDRVFWFALLEQITAETVLDEAIWQVAGQQEKMRLIRPPE